MNSNRELDYDRARTIDSIPEDYSEEEVRYVVTAGWRMILVVNEPNEWRSFKPKGFENFSHVVLSLKQFKMCQKCFPNLPELKADVLFLAKVWATSDVCSVKPNFEWKDLGEQFDKLKLFETSYSTLIILGDPLGSSLVPFLLNDIYLSCVEAEVAEEKLFEVTESLISNKDKSQLRAITTLDKCQKKLYILALYNPTIMKLFETLDYFLVSSGSNALQYKIILCGHGEISGHFVLCDGSLSGLSLVNGLEAILKKFNYNAKIQLYLNYCYADVFWRNFCSKDIKMMFIENLIFKDGDLKDSFENVFRRVRNIRFSLSNTSVFPRFLGMGLMPAEGGLKILTQNQVVNFPQLPDCEDLLRVKLPMKICDFLQKEITGISPHIISFSVGCADCTLVTTGKTTILIDGAHTKDFASKCWPVIGNRNLNAVIVTHCDGDHIGGIIPLVEQKGDLIQELWMSSPQFSDKELESFLGKRSPQQLLGIWISRLNYKRKFPIKNEPLRGNTFQVGEDICCHILTPDSNLHNFVQKKISICLERALSIYNEASLAILMISHGTTMLFTGDAPEDEIIKGIDTLSEKVKKLLNSNHLHVDPNHLHVDYMDIPHHGSTNNTTKKLFEKVTASTYVWSSDGGIKFPTTMGTEVLHHLVDVHKKLEIPCQVIFRPGKSSEFIQYRFMTNEENHCQIQPKSKIETWSLHKKKGKYTYTSKWKKSQNNSIEKCDKNKKQ